MPTIQQLIRKPRKPRTYRQKSMHLQACPQKRGVCTRVYTTTPKKPNSAMRDLQILNERSQAENLEEEVVDSGDDVEKT